MDRAADPWLEAASKGYAVDWSLMPPEDPDTVTLLPLAGPDDYPNASYYHAGRWLFWVYLHVLDPVTGEKTTENVATTWTRSGAKRAAKKALDACGEEQ